MDHHTDDAIEHRALVARLAADLRPVRRTWSPWARLATWVVLALAIVAIAALVGLRHDLRTAAAQPRFLLALAVLLSGAGLAATAALLAAVPGRIGGREARGIGLGLLLLAVAAGLLGERGAVGPLPGFVATGVQCTACVGLFGLVPWLALFWAVRRGAPVDGRIAGLCTGAAAFLVGAAAVRVACPLDDVVHLALWHGMPVALWALASTAASEDWLARWMLRS